MRRGEIWTAAGGADYAGKPRPVLILQTDLYRDTASITTCGFTSDPARTDLVRPTVTPTADNGLRAPCRLMVDKIGTVPRTRLRERIGVLAAEDMARVDRALLVFLGLAA